MLLLGLSGGAGGGGGVGWEGGAGWEGGVDLNCFPSLLKGINLVVGVNKDQYCSLVLR